LYAKSETSGEKSKRNWMDESNFLAVKTFVF